MTDVFVVRRVRAAYDEHRGAGADAAGALREILEGLSSVQRGAVAAAVEGGLREAAARPGADDPWLPTARVALKGLPVEYAGHDAAALLGLLADRADLPQLLGLSARVVAATSPAGLPEVEDGCDRLLARRLDDVADLGSDLLTVAAAASPEQRHRVARRLADAGPLQAAEWAMLERLPLADRVALASAFPAPGDVRDVVVPSAASLPTVRAWAATVLDEMRARLVELHAGAVAHRADGACTPGEGHLLGRAAAVALLGERAADEAGAGAGDGAGAGARVGELLLLAGVAPANARSMPSQVAVVALATAVVVTPTREALSGLDAYAAVCGHAGVRKKVDRLRRAARQRFTPQNFV